MKTNPFVDYLLQDAFRDVQGEVTIKHMFGGHGFYLDGRIFGFTIDDDTFVLKADDNSKQKFEELGGKQFVYTGHKNKGPVAMPYWTVPEEVLEDSQKLAEWIEASASLSVKK